MKCSGIGDVLSGTKRALPSAAACPGAALVKCTWYRSVFAGAVCAETPVAATIPPRATTHATSDLIESSSTPSRPVPALGALERLGPASTQGLDLRARHLRLEAALAAPLPRELVAALPEADGEPGEVRRAERGRLRHLRPDDWRADQVGLELHHEIVAGGAAVHAQLGDLGPGVGLHR